MQAANFEQIVERITMRDSRYHRDAYEFVREALDYTQKAITQRSETQAIRHVTGQELVNGIRGYALKLYGPMALLVLNEWGIQRCEDFGEIVFNMVESDLLAKTEQDSRADFAGHFTFEDAFRKPFLPDPKPVAALPAPKALPRPTTT